MNYTLTNSCVAMCAFFPPSWNIFPDFCMWMIRLPHPPSPAKEEAAWGSTRSFHRLVSACLESHPCARSYAGLPIPAPSGSGWEPSGPQTRPCCSRTHCSITTTSTPSSQARCSLFPTVFFAPNLFVLADLYHFLSFFLPVY